MVEFLPNRSSSRVVFLLLCCAHAAALRTGAELLSLVRSNARRDAGGLLRDWRRVNVAVSRACSDEGLLPLTPSNILYMDNPYSYKKFR